MADFLFSVDRSLFYFVNHSLQNVLFDATMPFLTDLNKEPVAIVIVLALWTWLLVKGGREGRIGAILLVVAVVMSDRVNSFILKFLFERLRPCHVLPDVHLLVSCGSGYAFPSSHAVNNFTGAVVLSAYVPKGRWYFYGFAALVAFTRVYVGVHYPSDVVAGSVIGMGLGYLMVAIYTRAEAMWNRRKSSRAAPTDKPGEE